MSELNLGQIIVTDQRRDAVHVAVIPVEADMDLNPGDHVGLSGGNAVRDDPHVGVVDPFLTGAVKEGQRFWLFLYPNTVTTLRHDWKHPAFPVSPERPTPQPHSSVAVESFPVSNELVMGLLRGMRATKDYSGLPIMADALEDAGYPNPQLLSECRASLPGGKRAIHGERLICLLLGAETAAAVRRIEDFARNIDKTYHQLMAAAQLWMEAGDYTYDNSESYKADGFYENIEAFWKNYETVTGTTVPDRTATIFTCSC